MWKVQATLICSSTNMDRVPVYRRVIDVTDLIVNEKSGVLGEVNNKQINQ